MAMPNEDSTLENRKQMWVYASHFDFECVRREAPMSTTFFLLVIYEANPRSQKNY